MAESPPRYRFTGLVTTGFFAYVDAETGSMLTAEPGKDYAIRATETGLSVPPDDVQWEAVAAAPAKAKPGKSTDGGES